MKLTNEIDKRAKRRKEKISFGFLATLGNLALIKSKLALANEFDFLKGKGNGTFDKATETVEETGASLYQFILRVGIVGLIITITWAGLTLASKSAQAREEAKKHILFIAGAAVVIFGGMTLIGIFASIGKSL